MKRNGEELSLSNSFGKNINITMYIPTFFHPYHSLSRAFAYNPGIEIDFMNYFPPHLSYDVDIQVIVTKLKLLQPI